MSHVYKKRYLFILYSLKGHRPSATTSFTPCGSEWRRVGKHLGLEKISRFFYEIWGFHEIGEISRDYTRFHEITRDFIRFSRDFH
jgi:hypothetical protein